MTRLAEHTRQPDVALMAPGGDVFAEIYYDLGHVELAHPDRLTEAATAFWDEVERVAHARRHRRRDDPQGEVYPR